MSKHTPTPWEVGATDIHGVSIYGPALDAYEDPGELEAIAEGLTRPDAAFIVRAANAHEALVKAMDGCDEWHSLCVECGPNVGVDEDGCCATCGATATGAYLDAFRVTARAALKLAEETP